MAEDLRDIASIRAEIEALSQRRSLLQHTLLSHPRTQKRLKRALDQSQPHQPIHKRIQSSLRKAERYHALSLQNTYRGVAGITSFKAKDPDPHAPFGGNVLGVRIDVFSRKERSHVKPYFLLLVQEEEISNDIDDTEMPDENDDENKDIRLRIHKHTIPPFIPLASLTTRYLHARSSKTGAHLPQNLQRLAQHLRAELVVYHARHDALTTLEGQMPDQGAEIGMRVFRRLDAAAREFEVVDEMGATVRVVVAEEPDAHGKIIVDRVVVRTMIDDREVGDEGNRGEAELARRVGTRYWHIERAILSGDKSVEGLFERLRFESDDT